MTCNRVLAMAHNVKRADLWMVALAAATVQFGLIGQARALPLTGAFTGSARSVTASVSLGDILDLQIANASSEGCTCSGTRGVTRKNSVASIAIGAAPLLSSGVATTTAFADKTATTAATKQTSTIAQANILGGLITADALTAAASVGATSTAFSSSEDGTTITNLVVAGQKIDANVADNTVILLAGIGSVTVKAVHVTQGSRKAKLVVDALVIDVTQTNSFGLPIGAEIEVAKAVAGYSRTQPAAALAGSAMGVFVNGNTAGGDAGLPGCSGSNGETITHTVSSLNLPNIVSSKTVTGTAFGGPVGAAMVVKTSATLSDISVLGGLITASSLKAVAQESRTGTVSTPSAAGSGFEGLTILGLPFSGATAPNTKVSLPLLGYVIVNEQTQTPGGRLVVDGLHVSVTLGNALGLPVGTDIIVGRAVASVKHF